MHISKRQSFGLVAAIFAAFALITTVLFSGEDTERGAERAKHRELVESLKREVAASQNIALEGSDSPAATSPEVVLTDFHRSEIKDGKLLWEVKAKRGLYSTKTGIATVEHAKVWIFRKNGDVFKLQAQDAKLKINVSGLTQVEAYNGVQFEINDELVAQSEQAFIDRTKSTVFCPGAVVIKTARILIKGEEMTARLDSEEFHLAQSVDTTIFGTSKLTHDT